MLYLDMENFKSKILSLQTAGKPLFYNSSGNKTAYQLGVKHISAAEFLAYADSLPNGDLRLRKLLILVNFEKKKIVTLAKGSRITPVRLLNF